MPGHYGEKKKKKRPSAGMRTGSFPAKPSKPSKPDKPSKPSKPVPKPRPPKEPRSPNARTGSFPIPKRKPAGAKAMKAATMALLKKKKKK